MNSVIKRMFSRWVFIASLGVLVLGCQKELYTQLSEAEANEMLALLLLNDMEAEKIYDDRENTVNLMIDPSDMAKAIQLLKTKGYPRSTYTNLGEVFAKDGMVSSPTEESARFVYAMSQEIAETLANLDGVLAARVHLVIPDSKKKEKLGVVSRAAVFIKHSAVVHLDRHITQIKQLVANSVEDLAYENISVALFPSSNAASGLPLNTLAEQAALKGVGELGSGTEEATDFDTAEMGGSDSEAEAGGSNSGSSVAETSVLDTSLSVWDEYKLIIAIAIGLIVLFIVLGVATALIRNRPEFKTFLKNNLPSQQPEASAQTEVEPSENTGNPNNA